MYHRHHHEVQHHKPSNKLHVIAVLSNPVGYNSRYRLFKQFQEEMRKWSVELHCVEMAFGPRAFEVTDAHNPNHVQVRSNSELWHKENLINIGFQHLPHDWQYAAWIDADVSFMNSKWVEETIHQLHHYPIVQLFQHAVDMGPKGEVMQNHMSAAFQHVNGVAPSTGAMEEYGGGYSKAVTGAAWHPGFAWAITRDGLDKTGPLIEHGILGAGDRHMAMCWAGMGEASCPSGLTDSYKNLIKTYQERCNRHIQGNIGYVPGTIYHHFHGKKKDRHYHDRWQLLVKHQFDPHTDLVKNSYGIWELAGNKPALRDDLRMYFRQRNEDSIDVE
jgi:hypothetical protein